MWRRGAPALAALALALAGSAGCGAAAAEARGAAPFAVSATLGDHMVLQRAPQSAAVWGFAPEGTVVRATFDGMTYTSTAGADEVWRVHLTPTAAGGPHAIALTASTGETALLSDVLFGDVYLCGGQSNMEFELQNNENAEAYIEEADGYPDVRIFTVGGQASKVPLQNLRHVQRAWSRGSSQAVRRDPRDPRRAGFSAVCWFFGKAVYDGLGGRVPIGLVSNNKGGTFDEQWMPREVSAPCGHLSSGELFNAMVVPYTVGPMALTGFTWYQGEQDIGGNPGLPDQNRNYTCTQAALIKHWRGLFQRPRAFFGVVQLSTFQTWGTGGENFEPLLLPELRDQQLASGDLLPHFAFATAADRGAGADIHPPFKQYPGARLANAALAVVYGKAVAWRSPTFAAAAETGSGQVTVWLSDVTDAGLVLRQAPNARTATPQACEDLNRLRARSCAWANLQFDDAARSWVNASVAVGADRTTMVLTATPPAGATSVVATAYGWGAIPMMSVYRADMDGQDGQLPVLPWNRTLVVSLARGTAPASAPLLV